VVEPDAPDRPADRRWVAVSLAIGIDVGGTKAAALLVDADGEVLARSLRPSSGLAYEGLVDAIAEAAVELLDTAGARRVGGIGLAIAGSVAADRSRVDASPHLPLHGQPLRDDLRARLGRPVVVENDANAAAWAEYGAGPFRGESDVVVLTVGTGLGGGLVVGGRLQRGAHGYAGEPGHIIVVPDGRECPCGGHGCWEQYASGSALVRAYQRLGGDASFDGPAVTVAAQGGDALAVAAFAEIADWLGLGLAGVVALLDPGAIVLGGGVAEAGDLLLVPVRERLGHHLAWGGSRAAPPLAVATLGNEAGALGAAALSLA
jgi:glucokinase